MKICNNCKKELPQFSISLSYVKESFLDSKFILEEFCSKECLFDKLISGCTISMQIQKVVEKKE